MLDPRWNIKLMLPTLLFQFAAMLALIGLSSSFLNSGFVVSIGPLSIASLGIVSGLTHLICYATSSLHPLVVLTLACEWMVLWVATTALEIVVYTQDPATGCGSSDNFDYYYYYGYRSSNVDDEDQKEYEDMLDAYREKMCRKSAAILALMVMVMASYIWLVAYSAVVRKRTRMPWVPSEQRPLMEQTRREQDPEMAVAAGTVATPLPSRAPLAGVSEEQEEEERTSGDDTITAVAPATPVNPGRIA